jgi:hypothetical protein
VKKISAFKLLLSMLFLLALGTYPVVTQAGARDRLEGETQSVRETRWSMKYLKDFVQSCLESQSECQEPETRKVLNELSLYLPSYDSPGAARWAGLLVFVHESDHPGEFTSAQGEAHRIAITQLQKFSPILINLDRMNLPLADWVGLLVHESVHHLGYKDDSSRLPDRAGAEVARHFAKRIYQVDLAEYGRKDLRTLIFNSKASGRLSLGMVSALDALYDIEWGTTDLVPLCDKGEVPSREFVGALNWRVSRFQRELGIVTIHGGGFVNIMCRSQDGSERRTSQFASANLELQYHAPLALETWQNETPQLIPETTAMGPSNNPADVIWGPNQSFWVSSMTNEKNQLGAGDSWTSRIALQGMDDFKPTTCEVFLTGTRWAFWKQNGMPSVAQFDSCKLKSTGAGLWELTITFQFPPGARSDDFYIPLIRFPDPTGDRFAVPVSPKFVHFVQPNSGPPAKIESWKITDLPAATALHLPLQAVPRATSLSTFLATAPDNIKLTSSYQARSGQTFTAEFLTSGDQALTDLPDLQIDLDFWTEQPGGIGRLFFNGPVQDLPQIITKQAVLATQQGRRVQLKFQMPAEFAGLPIVGLKISRIYLRTSDFSWTELALPLPNDAVILNAKYLGSAHD